MLAKLNWCIRIRIRHLFWLAVVSRQSLFTHDHYKIYKKTNELQKKKKKIVRDSLAYSSKLYLWKES